MGGGESTPTGKLVATLSGDAADTREVARLSGEPGAGGPVSAAAEYPNAEGAARAFGAVAGRFERRGGLDGGRGNGPVGGGLGRGRSRAGAVAGLRVRLRWTGLAVRVEGGTRCCLRARGLSGVVALIPPCPSSDTGTGAVGGHVAGVDVGAAAPGGSGDRARSLVGLSGRGGEIGRTRAPSGGGLKSSAAGEGVRVILPPVWLRRDGGSS